MGIRYKGARNRIPGRSRHRGILAERSESEVLFQHLTGRSHPAEMAAEAGNPIGHPGHKVQVMRNKDQRPRPVRIPRQPDQGFTQGIRGGCIEAGLRLVHEKDIGIPEQREGYEHALRFPAGELVKRSIEQRSAGGGVDDPPKTGGVGRASGKQPGAHAGQFEELTNRHRTMRVDPTHLRDIADARCSCACPNKASRCQGLKSGNDTEQGRLSSSVRTDQGQDAARTEVKIDARNYPVRPVARLDPFQSHQNPSRLSGSGGTGRRAVTAASRGVARRRTCGWWVHFGLENGLG